MATTTGVAPMSFRQRLRRMGGLRRSDWAWGYAFISINFLGFALFSLGPIIASFVMAFMEWPLLKPARFVGLRNVERLLDDDLFRTTLLNTAYFVAGFVPLVTVLAFLLAVLLNHKLPGRAILRTAYFLPSMTLVVSVAMVWQWILDPHAGVLNWLLRAIHIMPPQWLADRHWAMPTLIIVAVWQDVGYYAIIYLAGLQAIPATYYEAAEIDGANGWQKMVHITVPLVAPTTFFVIVISLIAGWQLFALPLLMTGGGPADATRSLLLYTYQQAFGSLRMGYAALMAWVLFSLIFVVTVIQWRIQKGGEHVLSS